MEDFSLNNKNFLSRNSSVGTSSRFYYCRSAAVGIPFQWERQPGTPKDPRIEEEIPPISPPPALLSLGLPKPCVNIDEKLPVKDRFKRRLIRFWIKKSKKSGLWSKESKFYGKKDYQNDARLFLDYSKDDRLEFGSSDGDFMGSPACNSSSSSMSSLSFSRQSSRLQSPAWNIPPNRSTLSCSPWKVSSFFMSLAKRV